MATKKKATKANNPAPKKVAMKKAVAKKPQPPKAKAVPPPTKKSIAKQRAEKKADEYRKKFGTLDEAEFMKPDVKKPLPNRVPPRIIKRPQPATAVQPEAEPEVVENTAAISLAARIALAKKQLTGMPESQKDEVQIRLSRRPTTRDKGKTTVTFSKKDLAEFRKKLLVAREAAVSGINGLKATGFNESEDREADGGDGTNQSLRLQALGQMGSANRTISKIEEALHRIEDGSYGVCTVCGKLIRKPRLLNQPFVLTCMECQNEIEKSASR